jgi:SAM-dependent methyltransferase
VCVCVCTVSSSSTHKNLFPSPDAFLFPLFCFSHFVCVYVCVCVVQHSHFSCKITILYCVTKFGTFFLRQGLNQRWLREWMAQQAGMGVLLLLPGIGDTDEELHYRLPAATAEVLANPDSTQYDISMIQTIPSLVNRAKTMLPEAFSSGIGRPYDEPEVADAIDRHHRVHIRDVFIPEVLPKVPGLLQQLQQGIQVADLGCGAANMLVLLAQAFPNSFFHGYEISKVALQKGAYNIARSKCTNISLHDANDPTENLGQHVDRYDLVVTFDVLHDSTHPLELIQQVKAGVKTKSSSHQKSKGRGGIWLLADILSAPTVRENLTQIANPAIYYGFSTCLCMSCALSVKGGKGLGTLGFSIPVAQQLLQEGGFDHVEVVLEKNNARWFLVQ